MTTQREFWSDTGQTCPDGETLPTLLHTPTTSDAVGTARKVDTGQQRDLRNDVRHKSISSVVDSPASLFRWRELDEETVMNAGFGRLFAELSTSWIPATWLSKTSRGLSQRMLDGSLEEYSGTCPRAGTMRNGRLYQRPRLVRRISEKEFSLLPTSTKSCGDKNGPASGSDKLINHLLPTPTANRYGSCQGGSMGREGQKNRPSLETMASSGLLPTPTSRDHRSGKASEVTHQKNSRPLSEQIGGLLNPQFVEAIMGFPTGWTDCEDSATQ